ncbi:DUF3007 family protein [Oscillatoria sp. FACHB-1406]|uniref:DUF3007 family protein n=1 Tax=Oscillatoria sp. FACHB-1406 TaxID=2692846 RepID=UPI001686FFA3|nr:DUF3007 family protein [Oscillatoria sp. FACHB-1406]MBD2579961.1 DUF3007 family protein [Oscillatoria sp. FACHB-1406]
MRRIDVFGIGIGIFLAGAIGYGVFKAAGLDSTQAGIWSQVLLVGGLLGWVATYLFRAGTKTMTYHQQRKDYEDAAFQKRLDEMTPEEIEALKAEIEKE